MSDPALEDVALLLVDGDNLLHAVRGSRDEAGVAWLLPRVRAWRPAGISVVVTLDGHPDPGETARRRVAPGIEFHHSGSRSADDHIVELLSARPYAERARTIVITRDAALQARVRRAGGRPHSVDWWLSRLDGAPGGADGRPPVRIGAGRPARRPEPAPQPPGDASGRTWQPGRGATRKRGNPRRAGKRSRGR